MIEMQDPDKLPYRTHNALSGGSSVPEPTCKSPQACIQFFYSLLWRLSKMTHKELRNGKRT